VPTSKWVQTTCGQKAGHDVTYVTGRTCDFQTTVAYQPIPPIVPIPPPVLGPQPNFADLNLHLQTVAHELALPANVPGIAIQVQLQHLVDQSNLIIQQLQLVTDAVNRVTATYAALLTSAWSPLTGFTG
jgi:hypothetical protein